MELNREFQKAIGRRVPRGEGAAWRAIETGRTFVVSDYSHWHGRASVLAGISIPAVLSVPLWGGAGPFGALNVTRTGAPLTFSEDDIHLVELFAPCGCGASRGGAGPQASGSIGAG